MPSKQQRTRNRIFQCRDFARDTGTHVSLRLIQSSPDHPLTLRRCVLTFTPTQVYRQHPEQELPAAISAPEASRMADKWTQEEF